MSSDMAKGGCIGDDDSTGERPQPKKTKQKKKNKERPNVEGRSLKRSKSSSTRVMANSKEGHDYDHDGLQLERGICSYGVQPLGNLLFSACTHNIRDSGLGSLRVLGDETLCEILGLLQGMDLATLSLVSKAFYVFSHQDFLWRNLVLEKYGGDFRFTMDWRCTYVRAASSLGRLAEPRLQVTGFFSDYLFQSWLCSSLRMKDEWLTVDNIDRRANLSLEDFVSSYEEPNRPVIITDALSKWPALTKWNKEFLVKAAGDSKLAVGPVDMTMDDYFAYSESVCEERPLYLFDPQFAEKIPMLSEDYVVPVYFQEDLFSILGKDRPNFRWLIIGPARSGSSFHIDPNSTSAWNAVVRGAKKWVLFPPDVNPPGVHPSPDGAEVAAPVSIMEWFMNFYEQTKKGKKKPVECICRAGELMFIPNGWWHLVVNLEDSVAITQNYASRSNLLNVLEFLKLPNSAQLVSGTRDRVNLYNNFKSMYDKLFPGTIEELKRKAAEKAKQSKSVAFWDTIMDAKVGGFKFGF